MLHDYFYCNLVNLFYHFIEKNRWSGQASVGEEYADIYNMLDAFIYQNIRMSFYF